MELQRLEKIVSRDLPGVISLDYEVTAVSVQYMLEDFPAALAREAERIKQQIMQAAADTAHQNELRRLIQRCQYRLIMLDSRLVKYAKHGSELSGMLCQSMHRCLNELLSFMEAHFGKYIYWNAWVHKNFLLSARKEVHAGLQRTAEAITASTQSERLLSILTQTFQRFLVPYATAHVTYSRIRYMEHLQTELLKLNGSEDMSYRSLDDLLLTVNFNSRTYFDYWSDQLQEALDKKPTTLEKLTLLADAAKRIRQHAFIRRASYNPNALPLPVMMTNWIREESDTLEKIFNLSMLSGEPKGATANDPSLEKKTELGVSVAVLAAAIRSLVMSKTLPDENLTGLARMLSRCFTTIRSGGNFSTETFRQSYYNINDFTKQTVIEIFNKAIIWLKKN
jgi:hypothetical protein